jgi:hypothetical protein
MPARSVSTNFYVLSTASLFPGFGQGQVKFAENMPLESVGVLLVGITAL